MELDFKTVKALSSPTRVKILREVLSREATPTSLSDQLGKSKSTISSHLDELVQSELVEKDKKEGRKRVVYRPTRKAKAIVEGRERKVKFSIASSVFSSLAGISFIGYSQIGSKLIGKGGQATADQGGDAGSLALDSAEAGARAAEETASGADLLSNLASPENAFLFAGLGLLSISIFGILYGLIIRELG